MKKIITNDIYDINGYVRTEEIEIDVPDLEEEITSKEEELLRMYQELEILKQQRG
jgi:hypothetical protein